MGERLLERLRPLLQTLDLALTGLNTARGRPAGRLRTTVAAPTGRYLLKTVVPPFLE